MRKKLSRAKVAAGRTVRVSSQSRTGFWDTVVVMELLNGSSLKSVFSRETSLKSLEYLSKSMGTRMGNFPFSLGMCEIPKKIGCYTAS
jgi:hypothetical protein